MIGFRGVVSSWRSGAGVEGVVLLVEKVLGGRYRRWRLCGLGIGRGFDGWIGRSVGGDRLLVGGPFFSFWGVEEEEKGRLIGFFWIRGCVGEGVDAERKGMVNNVGSCS